MYLQKAKVKDSFQLAHTYTLRAFVYNKLLKDYASARVNLDTAIALLSDEKLKLNFYYEQFETLLPEALCNRAQAYYKLGDTVSAAQDFDTAWAVAVASKKEKLTALVAGIMGFWQMEDGQYRKAIENLTLALNVARKDNDYKRMAVCKKSLSTAYEGLNMQD